MEENNSVRFNSKIIYRLQGALILFVWFAIAIGIGFLIGELKINQLTFIWCIIIFAVPFVFLNKLRGLVTRKAEIIFNDKSFTANIYSRNGSDIKSFINYWEDIEAYKLEFLKAFLVRGKKLLSLRLFMHGGAKIGFSFIDNPFFIKDKFNSESVVAQFHVHVREYNIEQAENKIIFKPLFLATTAGKQFVYIFVILAFVIVVIILIIHPLKANHSQKVLKDFYGLGLFAYFTTMLLAIRKRSKQLFDKVNAGH